MRGRIVGVMERGIIMPDDRSIFVISDLHIGDGGPRDNFGHKDSDRPGQLTEFLAHVKRENGELIIIGDLFEFWQASLSKVIMHNLPLLDQLAELEPKYVLGNHDADLKDFIGVDMLAHPFFKSMSGRLTRTIGGKSFRFMHGHEVDEFNKGDAPGWGRMLAIFAGIFEEKNKSPMLPEGESVEEVLSKFGESLLQVWNWLVNTFKKSVSGGDAPNPKNELTPAQNQDRVSQMMQEYDEDRSTNGYDMVIVGHTHQPGRREDWYFNTGSWVTSDDSRNNFVRIEPDGNVAVFNWIDGYAEPNTTVV